MSEWIINPAWIKAGEGPHCDIPSEDLVQAIHRVTLKYSPFQLLMNPTNSDLGAANRRITEIQHNLKPGQTVADAGACEDRNVKPKQDLPAACLHVEATKNGWVINVNHPSDWGHTTRTPDFVFNNVFDCARKIVDLLQPGTGSSEPQSVLIQKLSEKGLVDAGTIAGLREDLIKTQAALDLMAAGREADARDHREQLNKACAEAADAERQRDNYRETAVGLEREILSLREQLCGANTKNEELNTAMKCFSPFTTVCIDGHYYDARNLLNDLNQWRKDHATAVISINRLQEEVRALKKQLQNQPITMITGQPRPVIDGKIYTVDDLCKEHSELQTALSVAQDHEVNLRTSLRSNQDIRIKHEAEIGRLNGVVKRLQKVVQELATMVWKSDRDLNPS